MQSKSQHTLTVACTRGGNCSPDSIVGSVVAVFRKLKNEETNRPSARAFRILKPQLSFSSLIVHVFRLLHGNMRETKLCNSFIVGLGERDRSKNLIK